MKFFRARINVPHSLWCILAVLLLCTTIASPVAARSAISKTPDSIHWLVVTGSEATVESSTIFYDALYTIDTDTNTVYGPFLKNELTTLASDGTPQGDDIFDVAVTSDGKTAIVASFTSSKIHFIDLTDPRNPVYLSSLVIPFAAEDIALTTDDRYALVSDGGYTSFVVVIDIATRTQASLLDMTNILTDDAGTAYSAYANSVSVAPDGTVLMADYFGGAIHVATLAADGALTYRNTYRYYVSGNGVVTTNPQSDPTTTFESFRPVNLSIAPDGVTVLVSDVLSYQRISSPSLYTNLFTLGIYKITAPGVLEFTGALPELRHAMQSITFSPDGRHAYLFGNNAGSYDGTASPEPINTPVNDRIYVVDILGPGLVEMNFAESVDLLRHTSAQYFGIDTATAYRGKIYATYTTGSVDGVLYPTRYISIVDPKTLELTRIEWGPFDTRKPIGIAAIPHSVYTFLPHITR